MGFPAFVFQILLPIRALSEHTEMSLSLTMHDSSCEMVLAACVLKNISGNICQCLEVSVCVCV